MAYIPRLITKPSRISEFSGTLINNIFTNKLTKSICSGLLITDVSDLLPDFVCGRKIGRPKGKMVKCVRCRSKHYYSHLKSALANWNWDMILQPKDIHMACSDFVKTFTQLYNTRCLIGKVHDKFHNTYKPWFTNGLVNTCKIKNNLYKISCM